MAASLELTSVQKGRGKVHLAPAVRAGEPVRTLCGQSFAPDGYRAVDAEADCSICLRRRRDPTVVAQAFFAADPDRVLELSVAQAQARRREPTSPAPAPRLRVVPEPRPRPAPTPAPQKPRRIGELDAQGLREFSDNVFVAADGSIVRMKDGRVEEVLGEGKFQLLRRGDRFELRAGDVVVRGRIEDIDASGSRQ